MRHRKRNAKLGRKGEHRNAMLANLVCSLIVHRRVTTTLAKAKAARPLAEKMVTLAKKGTLHHRRLAAARLHQEDAVRILFHEIAPLHQNRPGGYTRIVKLGQRRGDAAPMAILEWVEEYEGGAAQPKEKPAESAKPAPAPAEEKPEGEAPAEAAEKAEPAKEEAEAAAAAETNEKAGESQTDAGSGGPSGTGEESKAKE
ncbi:MAG: 50S ribosomal protein L17 [Verrucomicrobia bacterium]|nr:MAG: 50S ribosomal protein L17 [Verrucomicrobiota bacterium]